MTEEFDSMPTDTASLSPEDAQLAWNERVAMAEEMIPIVGRLYRERNIVTSIHGRSLVNQSAVDILKAHRFARRVTDTELEVADTLAVLRELDGGDITGSHLNVAELVEARRAGDLRAALEEARRDSDTPAQDVVLYGFGRIGRLLARILISHAGQGTGLRLRAIVVRRGSENDLIKRASLLRRDSIHGPFDGTITVDERANTILANGTLIHVIYSNDPAEVDYEAYGIHDAIVVDNTGRWRDEAGLAQHLQSKGVRRVLLTAPGKGSLPNIVFGINDAAITADERIITAASCTTNAITPVLAVLDERYGIDYGHVETVHSFTNDQNLIDNFHKGDRRGRSAALNMVITETGAASAVAKALPGLKGKLTGNAIRVPTPDVSMAILNVRLDRPTTVEELNGFLRDTSLRSRLRSQIDYIESPEVVSTDFVGSNRAGIVDGLATIVADEGRNAILYVWYDNEFGYSSQVIRVLERMAEVSAA